MKMNLLRTLMLCGLSATATASFAQTRYVDDVFTGVLKTADLVYDSNRSVNIGHPLIPGGPIITAQLKCDIYTPPANDTETKRPVVIVAHTGSFLPAVVNRQATGNKNDSAIVELCTRFAQKGYVAVALNYRLGWNASSTVQAEATEGLLKATYRGIQDIRNCIRYIRMNADMYGVDTSMIVVGGQGTGGYISLALGTVNTRDEIESNIKFLRGDFTPMVNMDTLGDWNGLGGQSMFVYSGDPMVSGNAHMIFNYGGSMGDSAWLDASSLPVVSLHVVTDPFAPYRTGDVRVPNGPTVIPSASGAGAFMVLANNLGINAKLNAAVYPDALSAKALDLSGGVKNLYPLHTAFPPDGAPWEWWDRASVQAATSGMFYQYPLPASGRAADSLSFLVNPGMSAAKGRAYIDTVVNFVAPRIAVQFDLVNYTGIKELPALSNHLSVYPNPAKGAVTIELPVAMKTVTVFDLTGRAVLTAEAKDKTAKLDVSGLNKGFYFINVKTEDGRTAVKRVVVE
jgi:alpha/beta superfamily hydrolase